MALSSPPTAVAPFDKGRLNAGLDASATTCYVAPIFKTVAGVRVKQGINTTSGCAIISAGDFTELVTYTGASVDATTKVTTITGLTRGRDPTQTTASASFAAGTGRIWAKGAKFTVVADATYFQSGVFTNVANTFTAVQTFGTGGAVRFSGTDTSGLRVKSLTEAERDALTPANGDFIYNSTAGVMNQYIAGAWAAIGTDATANASTTVAGKVEEATVAQLGAGTAAGETGARLFINPSSAVKTSSGAGDENKLAVLNASGQLASGFLGTGSPSSSNFLRGDRSWATPPYELFGTGSDGAPTWTSGASLDPATEKQYTTATVPSGQTITVSSVNTPLVIHNTGDVTIDGTVDLNGKGGAGGAGTTGAGTGSNGTAGASKVSGWTNGAGTGAANAASPGGGGAGASWDADGGAAATNGDEGSPGTKIDSDKYAFLASIMRGVVCGGGGGGGSCQTNGNAGGGGAGGGAMVWLIGGSLTLGASSIIRADGANGTAGSATTTGTAGGGGGGGGGMIVILVGGSITNGGATLTAAGGTGGGSHASGSSNNNQKGGDGAAGKVIIYSLSTGTLIAS